MLRTLRGLLAALAVSSPMTGLPQAPAVEPPAVEPPAAPALVVLKDGQQLRGTLVARDDAGITLELEGGGRVTVPAASVERVEVARPGQREVRSPDPNRTRYLYSPSAFMLERGEGYVSQTELVLTNVAYGFTDHVTAGAGLSIPLLFVDEVGPHLVGTLKVGGSASERVHLAAGIQGFWLPNVDAGTTVGVLFGTVTLGTPDAHLSLSAGPPFVAGDEENDLGAVLVSISGAVRLTERLALVSENWVLPGADGGYALSGALRFIGQRLGVDAGLILAQGSGVPVPWLDFTFSFGR